MMSKKKKVILTSLASTLAASSALAGMPAAEAAFNGKEVPALAVQKPQLNIPERLAQPEQPKEIVRVIVELEAAPAIDTATKQGVSYKELSDSSKASAESVVEKQQADVQSVLQKSIGAFEVKESFTTVFNGFSLEVKAEDVQRIALTPGVAAVYESQEYKRPEVQPQMISSKELVQAQLAWEKYEFKGEGMVVGVIDSGIDPNHRDFVLTNDASGEITEEEVNAALTSGEVEKGKYFSAKVPFGYNYMDDNYEVRDIGPGASMHGQHVSGTVGANGDELNGGVKGVAPEAQILALKVFGNDKNFGSTFGDVYVKALDDAIKLGADVINMSLGSVAGYVDENSPEQQAVGRAKDNGLLVSISAGNSDLWGSDNNWYPGADNQDYGLTGSPSVSEGSVGVASFENTEIVASAFSYLVDDEVAGEALFLLANDVDAPEGVEFEVMDAGIGTPADFEGKDFTGKFALVSRGSIAFTEKGLNAQAAGAAGVIIYNNAAGTINMASDPAITIPYMSALQADGRAMKALLDAEQTVEVRFDGNTVSTPNPESGSMSSFTSWGPTPNLDFKPEITAPGGNIYSTFNNNEYGLMSGTSMAAPHVAGGAALIFERVDKEFGLSGYDRSQMVKNLLMNTSKPVELNPGEYVSPRRQGAGIMQLANALETDVIVYDKATGEGKVALKEIADGQFSLNLEAKNFSDTEKTYNVSIQLQSDYAVPGPDEFLVLPNTVGSYVFASTGDAADYTVELPASVTVPANGTADLTINVDASGSEWLKEQFTNGYFIDGFVTLEDATPGENETENLVPLTVPFFGFNGSWDDAPIFDQEYWKGDLSYYGVQGLYDAAGFRNSGKLGAPGVVDPTSFAFSPNADGELDTALPVFSLERNAKEFEVNVLDKDGKKLRTIATSKNLLKHYSAQNPYTFNPMYAWDGKIAGKLAAQGDYQIELRAKIDFEGAEWQSVKYPIKLDTTAPEFEIDVDQELGTVEFTVADDFSGVNFVDVYANGELIDTLVADESGVTAFDFSSLTPGAELTFTAYDVAGNTVTQTAKVDYEVEEGFPVIDWITPEFFDVFNTSEVEVTGSVSDDSEVVKVTVNGEEADEFDGTDFSHTATFDDGVHKIKVAAEDMHGNESSIQRQVFVDTTLPTLELSGVPASVGLGAENPTIGVKVGDNFDYARVYVNGDEVYFQDLSEPYQLKAFTKTVDVELALEEGSNTFEVKVVDVAGNEKVQNFTINKADTPVVMPPTTTPPPVTPPVTPPTPDTTVGVEDVNEQVADTTTEVVTVPVPELVAGEILPVDLPAATINAVQASGKSLVLTSGGASFELSNEVLTQFKAAGADKVVISLRMNGSVSTASSVKLANDYTISASAVKGAVSTPLLAVDGEIEVSLPLLKAPKDARKTAAYFVSDAGAVYAGGVVDGNKLTFSTNKMGTFTALEKAVTFTDSSKHWAKEQIEVLASRSIVQGKSETMFGTDANITRAEFAVLIARALNLPMENYKGTFKDVPASKAWAYAGVEAAYEAGIVNGKSETTFDPDANITRQEIAAMIVRAVEYQDAQLLAGVNPTHQFADQGKIGAFAKESVQLAHALGIINGRAGNAFDPTANATRAESAVMLYRALDTLNEF